MVNLGLIKVRYFLVDILGSTVKKASVRKQWRLLSVRQLNMSKASVTQQQCLLGDSNEGFFETTMKASVTQQQSTYLADSKAGFCKTVMQ